VSRWFRLYNEAVNDSKILLLPNDSLRWQWVVLLSCASQHDGVIPSLQHAALALRLKATKAAETVAILARAGLLDQVPGGYFAPHNWTGRQYKSDDDPTNAERQQRYRDRKKRNSEALRNGQRNADETRTEAETDTESETDQRSVTTSSSSNSSSSNVVENVKENRWTPPRHCAVSRDKRRIYVEINTPEWEAYASDFRAIHQQEPQPTQHGGRWFYLQGEAA